MYTIIIGMLMAVFVICVGFLFTNELTCIMDKMDKKKKTETERENIKTPTDDKKIKKL